MADIGLYKMKYPFRKLIAFLVPLCANINPNTISIWLLPLGVVTALTYGFAPHYHQLYLVGVALIFCRMIVATLDGLVAVTYHKDSSCGELINRICPELCDLMLLGAILLSQPRRRALIVAVLLTAWATSFFGLVGLTAKRPIQSVGPVGQTDRLAALMLFSFLAFLGSVFEWNFDFIRGFLIWTVVGGVLTVALRCSRSLRASEGS